MKIRSGGRVKADAERRATGAKPRPPRVWPPPKKTGPDSARGPLFFYCSGSAGRRVSREISEGANTRTGMFPKCPVPLVTYRTILPT